MAFHIHTGSGKYAPLPDTAKRLAPDPIMRSPFSVGASQFDALFMKDLRRADGTILPRADMRIHGHWYHKVGY